MEWITGNFILIASGASILALGLTLFLLKRKKSNIRKSHLAQLHGLSPKQNIFSTTFKDLYENGDLMYRQTSWED